MISYFLYILLALVALAVAFARERRLPVAINSAIAEPGKAARMARTSALMAAGLPQLYAEKFATDAVEAQAWHDNPEFRTGEQARPLSGPEKDAQTISAATKRDAETPVPDAESLDSLEEELEERESEVEGREKQVKAKEESLATFSANLQVKADALSRQQAEADRKLAEAKELLAKAEALKAEAVTPEPQAKKK